MALKEILGMLGPPLAVGIFVAGQIIDRNKRRQNLAIEAYYKITYAKASDKIDKLIEDIDILFEENFLLHQAIDENLSTVAPMNYKAETLAKFGEMKRKFELSVISLYALRYHGIAQDMTDLMLDIEDDFTNNLDEMNSNGFDRFKFSNNLYGYRTKFYRLMLLPIENEKKARKFPWQ